MVYNTINNFYIVADSRNVCVELDITLIPGLICSIDFVLEVGDVSTQGQVRTEWKEAGLNICLMSRCLSMTHCFIASSKR